MFSFKEIRKRSRKTKEFKDLTAVVYRDPKGYPQWKTIAEYIAADFMIMSLSSPRKLAEMMNSNKSDFMALIVPSTIAVKAPAIVRWIKPELAEAFLRTSSPPLDVAWLEAGIVSYRHGVIMLPSGAIKTSEGTSMQAITWLIDTSEDNSGVIYKAYVDGSVYYTGFISHLKKQEELMIFNDDGVICEMGESEKFLMRQIESILTQSLALMFSEQCSDLEEEQRNPSPKRRKKMTVAMAKAPMPPKWVGEHIKLNYQRREHQGGTHASPVTHWRRGHWRSQPYGPKSELRRPIWVQPCLVAHGE